MRRIWETIKGYEAIIVSFLFVGEGVFLLSVQDENTPTYVRVMAWSSVLFFGLAGLVMLYNKLRPRHGVALDWNRQSLTFFYNRFNGWEVEWKHITGFRPCSYGGMRYVAVDVDNLHELLASTSNPLKQHTIRFAIEKFGTYYYIPAERLVVSPEQLCEQLDIERLRFNNLND